ncbi:MAG: hypothetical protein HUJ65_02680, partial [Oscillospiraceae bacterium]|nr:hypothetical protein [Oscillospiraceae bacterium]
MKKYLALILALTIVFTLCACGTPEKAADKSPAEIAEEYIGKDLKSLTAAIG